MTITPPDRRPTIRDVAAAAGVSKSLVSLVYAAPESVSAARRQRVFDAADALGYRRPNQAARSLAAAHGGLIAILVADLHNPVLFDLVDAARSAFAESGQVALVTAASLPQADGHPRLDRPGLELFGDLRPSALLVIGSVPEVARLAHIAPGRPIALASTIAPELTDAWTVRGDDWSGIHLLVRHLVELGHRDIAHVGGAGGAIAALRADAYRAAMGAAGLGAHIRVGSCDFSEPGGHNATAELLRNSTPPTAVIAINDLAAVGAMAAAADARTRLAVTGYDGTYLAALRQIDLTTIDPNNVEIGRTAARLLMHPDGMREVLVPPKLVIRGSTTRP